jgi:hypothetical protein
MDALLRAETLLEAVCKFIDSNPVHDYTVFYDGAECDGYCLHDDCDTLLEEIKEINPLLAEGVTCT